MNRWIDKLNELAERNEDCMVLTVARVRGSAPREVGAKMLVTAKETIGTIGGGQLEYQCARTAFEQIRMVEAPDETRFVRRYPLGANCGQCCGGVVDVMYEYLSGMSAGFLKELQEKHDRKQPVIVATGLVAGTGKYLVTASNCMSFDEDSNCPSETLTAARDLLVTGGPARDEENFLFEPVRPANFHIAMFGAGHVGAATVDVLSRLDCSIRWIDNRSRVFPGDLPGNVTAIETAEPAREVAAMPPGAFYLVMTHSHPLDQEICAQVLQRSDFAYCGLIGSHSKRRRFERQLKKIGLSESSLQRLTCPIGVTGIQGKRPVEIALAVAAQLLQVKDAVENLDWNNKNVAQNVHVI
jgi:xanthine dehydrogenase accessory factor